MKVLHVTICETPDGWINTATGFRHASAMRALKAAQARAERARKATGRTVVTLIDWEPTSGLGALVVKTITGTA